MKKHYRHENDCLNCGTELQGKWCHNCGQENLQIKESFGHMVVHAVSDYFHFDHQFFHTLRPLFLKPGKLTNEYMAGRRMQYLHPVKMYIFISLVFFILFFRHTKSEDIINVKEDKKTEKKKVDSVANDVAKALADNKFLTSKQKADIVRGIKESGTGKEALNKERVVDKAVKHTAAKAEKGISSNSQISDSIRKTDKSQPVKTDKGFVNGVVDGYKEAERKDSLENEGLKAGDNDFVDGMVEGFKGARKTDTYKQYLERQNALPKAERDNAWERLAMKMSYKWGRHGEDAKEVFMEAVKHNVPKMMFILLPIFALILKITFWRNRKFYVEHLIFSIHLHCFIFLFFTLIILMKMIIPPTWSAVLGWIGFLSFIATVWYIYRSLRTVYHRSRFRTITKMMGMSFMYLMVFTISILALFAITAVTAV